jgi:hypothetical protein
MTNDSSEEAPATEWASPVGGQGGETPGAGAQADPPMEAYRKCERMVRGLIAPYVAGEPEVNSLAAAIMTCAQDYALTMARFYMESRATLGDSAPPPTPER